MLARPFLVAAVIVGLGQAAWGICGLGRAQSPMPPITGGHAQWHEYYRHWKQPGTDTSCCNARQALPWGAEQGDCEPTRAEMRKGDWYAWERHTQQWLKVPDAKIIRERNPSPEAAHLCWTSWAGILCFVPPDTGD
jgi:hypothetical protein